MSSQKGNVAKKRPPKYQNKSAFKNNMHDCSKKTKAVNSMTIGGVCDKCRETIQWKIKYKKYKPLTQSKKCTKCSQKTVKYAYHIICAPCSQDTGVCAKCGTKKNSINPYALTPTEQAAEDSKLEAELKHLSERKRRAFFRWQDKGFTDNGPESAKEAEHFEEKEIEWEDSDAEDEESNKRQYDEEGHKCSDMEELVNVAENRLDLYDACDEKDKTSTSHVSDHRLVVHFDDALPIHSDQQFTKAPCQDGGKMDKFDAKEEQVEQETKDIDVNMLKDESVNEIS